MYPAGDPKSLSALGFTRLLETLHPDAEQAAEEYERLRRTLVKFFDWRGISTPDDADEVFDRLARKLEDTVVRDVRKYAYGIARLVALERRRGPIFAAVDDMSELPLVVPPVSSDDGNRLHDCFERCLDALPEERSSLLLRYYEGERHAKITNRRKLATMLGLTENALRSRASRPRRRQNGRRRRGGTHMKGRTLALIIAIVIPVAAQAADRITVPPVPDTIAVTEGYKPFLKGHAVGTQNYICAPDLQNGGVKWLAIGPQATVFNAASEQILTHYQSENPIEVDVIDATWQDSRDTSAVWARKIRGSADPAYVAPDAIEWLLLGKTGERVGPDGGDRLTATVFIQRVNTVGGKAPATGCTASTLNNRKLVPYQADYIFYK